MRDESLVHPLLIRNRFVLHAIIRGMHEEKQLFAWSLTPEVALERLGSAREGLSEHEAESRLKKYGGNSLPRTRRFTVLGILTRQFYSPLIFILIGASVLTISLQEWIDTAVILLAILVNAGLGFFQEYRAETTLEKLTTYVKERTRVIRDGVEEEIDSLLLVPGDVIRLSYGARVPADARIIESNELSIDESVLTGESLAIRKQAEVLSEAAELPERINTAHAGTLVVEGTALALVTTTGAATEIGKIAQLVAETEHEPTPLQRALAHLGWIIFIGIAVLVAIIFFLGLSRGIPFFEMLLMAAAISVGAVPEALPIALTVILAVGVQRLAGRQGIIRKLAAAETLGSATVIMTDKTGTLTEANMRLVDIRTYKELITIPPPREAIVHLTDDEKDILSNALWGADVLLENPSDAKTEWRFSGRPIEVAIARAAHEHGMDVQGTSKNRASLLTFNSTNKFSISGNHAKELYVVVGAPDILLARSRLTKEDFLAMEAEVNRLSAEGKRLLGVARVPRERSAHLKKGTARAEQAADLEFLGVLVLQDPLRADAAESIQKIEQLGARVVMLTGDLKGTALSIARELGWEVDEGSVLTGEELRRLPDEALNEKLNDIRIFARVTPEDKLRVGRLFQKRGEVVAMTGDGVNDAPSLKAVNIGVALGSGTDVAKGVADLVLLNDNFSTIVSAIEEGRRILENIRKVFVYLTSTCLDAVFLIGGALIAGLPLPISALQIIWVNFFTDSLPALSFAFEKEYAKRAHGRGAEILTTEVKAITLGIGILTSILLFGMYWALLHFGVELEAARSTIFVCFALYGLIVAYSFRSLHTSIFSMPLFENKALNWSAGIGVVLIAGTMLLPFMREIFELAPLTFPLFALVLVWLVLNILIVEMTKWAFRSVAY